MRRQILSRGYPQVGHFLFVEPFFSIATKRKTWHALKRESRFTWQFVSFPAFLGEGWKWGKTRAYLPVCFSNPTRAAIVPKLLVVFQS